MIVLIWLLARIAGAADPAPETPWYVGLPVGQVLLQAPSGLPPEDLQPLLRATAGEPYDPAVVRADLELLASLRRFAAVEAHVLPWAELDEAGEPREVVWLYYVVEVAPELRRVVVRGVAPRLARELAGETQLGGGSRHLTAEDVPGLEADLADALVEAGFREGRASVELRAARGDRVDVHIRVDPGPAVVAADLRVVTEEPRVARRARRITARHGIRAGRPYAVRDLGAASKDLAAWLHEEGWLAGRVTPFVEPAPDGQDRVALVVETGERTVVERRGAGLPVGPWGLPARRRLVDAMGAYDRTAVGDFDLEEMEAALRRTLEADGHRSPEVDLGIDRDREGLVVITVGGRRGPRTVLLQRDLQVVGATAVGARALRRVAREAAPESLGRGVLTDAGVQQATRGVADVLRARGYTRVTVTAEPVASQSVRRAALTLRVVEGVQATLAEIEVAGTAPGVGQELVERSQAMVGRPYAPAELLELARRLTEAHREGGYLSADTSIRAQVTGDALEARARLVVDPGERAFVRNVVVRGNRRTRTERIEREITLELGQVVTPGGVDETRRRLYDTDLFEVVQVDVVGDDRFKDIVVHVVEKPLLAWELGGGLTTDEGLRAFSRVERRNVLGWGHRSSGLAQVGLPWVSDRLLLDPTAPEWRAALRYEAPNLPLRRQAVFVDALLNEVEQEPSFRFQRSGVGGGVELLRRPDRRVVLDYRLAWRRLQDVDPGALVTGDPWLEVPAGAQQRRGSLGVLALVDLRDDQFNPTRGVLLSTRLEAFDPWVNPAWSARGLVQGNAVVPAGGLSLRLGAQAGLAWVEGRGTTLPVEERFTLGGASTLRGQPEDLVGPKNLVPRQDIGWPEGLAPVAEAVGHASPDRWVPTGGDAMAQTSIELWTPLSSLGLRRASGSWFVTFVDLGNVWFLDPAVRATSQLVDPDPAVRTGVGVGLRLPTPVGPIQFDVGVNPTWFSWDVAAAQGEVPWRLHLSLGAS